jgi:hypothetical protein
MEDADGILKEVMGALIDERFGCVACWVLGVGVLGVVCRGGKTGLFDG